MQVNMPPSAEFPPYIDFDKKLVPAVGRVLERLGMRILEEDEMEGDQNLVACRVYTIGLTKKEAIPVVLIGNSDSLLSRAKDAGKDRPHRLIANDERIIEEVQAELRSSLRSNPRQP